jgi:hemerythrin
MTTMEWKPEYSVGLPELDEHHRHLFVLLNNVYEACMLSKQKDVFCKTVSELAEYTCYHFAAEEKLMEDSKYPGLDVQRAEHLLFTNKIAEYFKIKSLDNEECVIELIELSEFLMNWLTHHILIIDMQYSNQLG